MHSSVPQACPALQIRRRVCDTAIFSGLGRAPAQENCSEPTRAAGSDATLSRAAAAPCHWPGPGADNGLRLMMTRSRVLGTPHPTPPHRAERAEDASNHPPWMTLDVTVNCTLYKFTKMYHRFKFEAAVKIKTPQNGLNRLEGRAGTAGRSRRSDGNTFILHGLQAHQE